jgi:hypothetical protein
MEAENGPMRKPVALVSLALSAAVGVALLSATPQRLDAPMPEARTILARATWNAEQNVEGRFRRTMNDRLRKYDDEREITEDVTRGYLVEPHQGVPYAKLVTKDDEEKRWNASLVEGMAGTSTSCAGHSRKGGVTQNRPVQARARVDDRMGCVRG